MDPSSLDPTFSSSVAGRSSLPPHDSQYLSDTQASTSSSSYISHPGTSHNVSIEQHQQSLPAFMPSVPLVPPPASKRGTVHNKTAVPAKRRKVSHACLYCRRSHMTCDDGRPCQRCIKRDIGHLCHDEQKLKTGQSGESSSAGQDSDEPGFTTGNPPLPSTPDAAAQLVTTPDSAVSTTFPPPAGASPLTFPPLTDANWPLLFPQDPNATSGNEFSVLSEFLDTLEDQAFFNGGNFGPFATTPAAVPQPQQTQTSTQPANILQTPNAPLVTDFTTPSTLASSNFATPVSTQMENFPTLSTVSNQSSYSSDPEALARALSQSQSQAQSPAHLQPPTQAQQPQQPHGQQQTSAEEHIDVLPAPNKTERFLLTAADQEDGTRDERLARVIHAKYEAGLLRPFNYVNGYARLSRWMDKNVSPQSKQQILQPLTVLRPKFRAIAQSLTDIDLVFIEEAFERLLLNYDRVFSAMGIPACLWRRTGEIYKGNKEFADLVGVDVSLLREGRLCIYELMSEESAVNYWEKYGHIAFDAAQKAVLTSCVLRYKPSPASLSGSGIATPAANITNTGINAKGSSSPVSSRGRSGSTATGGFKDGGGGAHVQLQEGFINCSFSFTIQRDLHGIPTLIAGNFIRH